MRRIAVPALILAPLLLADSTPEIIQSVSIIGTAAHVDFSTQVGQPYNASLVGQDLHRLWNLGRFADIRVEKISNDEGATVVFRVVERHQSILHKIHIEPSTYGLQLSLPEGAPINRTRAKEIAIEAQRQLHEQGFNDAEVEPELKPYLGSQVDLRLTVKSGERIKVRAVEFAGNTALGDKELRNQLRALRPRRLLPGWRLLPAYSPEAVQSDIAHLRSFYIAKGYLDARIRVDDVAIAQKRAQIRLFVDSGALYRIRNIKIPQLCTSLLAARRDAERAGILDFSVALNVLRIEDGPHPIVEVTTAIESGPPYRVGRINFSGHHHYSDAFVRRNFLLEEDQLFDERLLRKSMGRLNQTSLFDPVTERNIIVRTDPDTGVADISVRLHEHKGGAWRLSGPVGPASLAGPLEASLSSRLPPWGSGLFELSTYTASISLYAFASPLLLLATPKLPLLPVLSIQRPFSPGEGWKSGLLFAPQLGWRASVLSYSVTQLQQRVIPILSGDRGLVPALPVRIEPSKDEAVLFCEPPQPRWMPVRSAAIFAIRLAGAFTGL